MPDRLALFDMDGTLFGYTEAMRDSLLAVVPPDKRPLIESCDGNFHDFESEDWLKNLMDLIKLQPGWWIDLPKHQPGWDVYRLAESIGFCSKILTKGPRSKSRAWAEKVECIWKHFDGPENSPPIDIVTKDKMNSYGRVLVEDFIPYLEPWLEKRKRGLGILIDHPYNRGWEHPNCVRYTGDNIDEVREALLKAFHREPKQPWQEFILSDA
jgi:5'-nucleotidase